jgi:hypothetical protein
VQVAVLESAADQGEKIVTTVQSTARALMEEAHFDLTEAKKHARERLKTDPKFAEVVTPLLCEYALDRLLEDVWRSGRAAHWQQAMTYAPTPVARRVEDDEDDPIEMEPQPAPSRAQPRTLAKGETSQPSPSLQRALQRELSGLMAFPMPGGTKFALWESTQLDALGLRAIKQGRATMATGFWFRAVAEIVPKGKRVCDVLTNNDLERLMRQQGGAKAVLPNGALLPA